MDGNVLETDRLVVRRVQISDLDTLHNLILSNSELMDFGLFQGCALGREESRRLVEAMAAAPNPERLFGPSVFLLKPDLQVIGCGGLSSESTWRDLYRTIDGRLDGELYYVFVKEQWGRGFATELSRLLISDALARGADRIWASTLAINSASQHVLEKVGMRLVGQELIEGKWSNLYEIVRSESEQM